MHMYFVVPNTYYRDQTADASAFGEKNLQEQNMGNINCQKPLVVTQHNL